MPITSTHPGSPFAVGPKVPADRRRLALRAIARLVALFILAAALLFLSAGTLHFWEAKAYLVSAFVPTAMVLLLLFLRNPVILERRLETRETIAVQRNLMRWFRPVFLIAFLVPGLDHRFGWSRGDVETVPPMVALAADGFVVVALLFAGWVMQINAYAGRRIEVEAHQPLITRGPYSLIRHPLYAASVVLWLATPVALGSWMALPIFLLATPFYVLRLLNEERYLKRDLPGYSAYCKRTPFRLIPFVW